jgi:hypothetical protein
VDVGDVERLDVDESRDLQRANAVVSTLDVVTAGLIAVEASRIDGSVASAFLGASAEKRTPAGHRNRLEPIAEDRVVGQSR